MIGEVLLPQIAGIFIVVDDIEKSIRTYEDDYGIGPWVFQDFSDAAVPTKVVAGETSNYQVKLAICSALNVNLALIQPLDQLSIFSAHLRSRGPGLHHLLMTNKLGFEETLNFMVSRGNEILQRGVAANDAEFAHVNALRDLGIIVELFKMPSG